MRGTPLNGAIVLVTGAGSGIGRLTALGAAERGAQLVLWDLSAERVKAVATELEGQGRTVVAAQVVDVSDKESVRSAAADVLEQVGAIDVLVNNAGVVSGQALTDVTDEGVTRTFAVNVMALFWVTKAFLPAMIERHHGHVVTIASAAGLVGVAKQTDYSASKHAAVGFDESLRQEMRALSTGVRTTVVCPYYIDTGMFAGVKTRWRWLLPILKEQRVANRILDAIERGHQRVVLPRLVGFVPVLRILPVRWFDAVSDVLGINKSMEHFTGRAGDVVGRDARP